MITITWGNLRDQTFMQALGKLYSQPMGYESGLKFALIGKQIKNQQKLCDEVHEGILKKFGTADTEKKGFYKLNEETKDQYAAEMKKLEATEFHVRVSKFNSLELSEVIKFSPQDLMILEPLFEPFEIPSDVGAPTLGVVPSAPTTEAQAPASH